MGQGLPIAMNVGFATSTTESSNQVKSTYDYIGPGMLKLYAFASAATVRCNLFVSGNQILRNEPVIFVGTSGGLQTSEHLITSVGTIGGRVELTFTATTGTPTVDYLLTHDGVPFGKTISKLLGR